MIFFFCNFSFNFCILSFYMLLCIKLCNMHLDWVLSIFSFQTFTFFILNLAFFHFVIHVFSCIFWMMALLSFFLIDLSNVQFYVVYLFNTYIYFFTFFMPLKWCWLFINIYIVFFIQNSLLFPFFCYMT